MNDSEGIIWKQIQQKNEEVFESYYKEHYKTFFLQAYKYLKSEAPAQEIVNDVFIKIWEDSANININVSLKSYIYKAIINRSINALNREKKTLQNLQQWTKIPEGVVDSSQMEVNELKIRLYKAIDQLPEQCQRVFRMSRFEELKQQEIADKLGISIKTVKNHITHALKELNKSAFTLSLFCFSLAVQIFFECY